MKSVQALTIRNMKLYFKDRGAFLTSMTTPLILLVLYLTFLARTYRSSFQAAGSLPSDTLDGLVAGQLISSILSVSCVTVAFFTNMRMVEDRVNGSIKDLRMTPVRGAALALGYYLSAMLSALIVCLVGMAVCLAYMGSVGWFPSAGDIAALVGDITLSVLFGTTLSGIIHFFLKTQGQLNAVGTIISAGYGFICGAYMPISQFSEGLRSVLSFFPGMYGTVLIRNHCMDVVYRDMAAQGIPNQVIDGIRTGVDCNLFLMGDKISIKTLYLLFGAAITVLLIVYLMMNRYRNRKVL